MKNINIKIKRIISSVMTAAVAISAAAAGLSSAAAAADHSVIDLVEQNKIKIQGRYFLNDDADGNSLMLENSASGIEFAADCSGDVTVTLKATRLSYAAGGAEKGGIYFTVIVDGELQHSNERIPEDSNANSWTSNITDYPYVLTTQNEEKTFILAENLEAGEHTFEIYCQSQAKYGAYAVESIGLDGEFLPAPENKELYIEFVGDSITAGHGNIADGGTSDENSLYTDATRGWAYLTARKLGADWSVIAQSGIAATDGVNWARNPDAPVKDWPSIGDVYPKLRFYSDQVTDYDFARQPDFIVVALGTNDTWLVDPDNPDNAYYGYDIQAGFEGTLDMLRTYNPQAKIIWVYGMLTDGADDQILAAAAAKGGEEAGIYTLELPMDKSGGSSHPGLAVQETYAATVSGYISSIINNTPFEPEEEVWDGSKPTEKPAYMGAGTAEDPYMITNGAELYWAISNENQGVYFKLANDIVLNDFRVEIIESAGQKIPKVTDAYGNVRTDSVGAMTDDSGFNSWLLNEGSAKEFKGVLDGNNFIIRGLFYNMLKNSSNYQNTTAGLIPNANNAKVYNLGIEDSYLWIDNDVEDGTAKQGVSVAALFGRVNNKTSGITVENSYIGQSVYIYGNVVSGFFAVGAATNGVTFKNIYSLATLKTVPGASKARLGAIGADTWNLATNKPNDYESNTATNVYANAKLFGNKAPFCYNAYGTEKGGSGPQVWDEETGANTSEYVPEVAITIPEENMFGLEAAQYMELGEAFEFRENSYPVLKSFANEQPEPSPQPERPEDEWDGSLDRELAGEGTQDYPYLVTNAGELAFVVESGGVENAFYELTNDIYLNDGSKIDKETGAVEEGYLIIPWYDSSEVKEFKGAEFDGGGHVVYGLYANFPGEYKFDNANGCTALFPITRKDTEGTVTIRNLGIADSYMRNYSTAAAIVGYGGNSPNPNLVIENCFSEETVTLVGYNAGGIFGSGSINIEINNCYSLASLKNNGGKAGLAANFWGSVGVKEMHIKSCYSTGKIAGNQVTSAEYTYENFSNTGADALASIDGFDADIWYAVKDDTKTPMLRVRGAAIGDIDENGIFESAVDLAAQRKLLFGENRSANNGDTNTDGEFDIRDLIALKKLCANTAS